MARMFRFTPTALCPEEGRKGLVSGDIVTERENDEERRTLRKMSELSLIFGIPESELGEPIMVTQPDGQENVFDINDLTEISQ